MKLLRVHDLLRAAFGNNDDEKAPRTSVSETVDVDERQKTAHGIEASHTHAHVTEQVTTHTEAKAPHERVAHKVVDETVDVDETHKTAHGTEATHTHAHVTEDKATQVVPGASHEKVTHTNVSADSKVTTTRTGTGDDDEVTTSTLTHVHATISGVTDIEMTPPHPPREDTPIYMRTHRHLIFTLDKPCVICGVRKSTVGDPKQNRVGAKDLETHHHPIERCLMDACDPVKVGKMFPQVTDRPSLEAFVDSEANMMVLCDIHHRHPLFGIHHIVGPDFNAQPYLYEGYQVVVDQQDEAAIMATDEKIVHEHVTIQELEHGEVVKETTVHEERVVKKETHKA